MLKYIYKKKVWPLEALPDVDELWDFFSQIKRGKASGFQVSTQK